MIELILLILTIYLEAEGECFIGKQAVGNVIYNRHLKSGKSVTEVILQPKQFSCWNNIEYVKRRLSNIDKKAMIDSFKAGLKLKDDITNGATHYTRVEINRSWMRQKMETIVIGEHKFLKRNNNGRICIN